MELPLLAEIFFTWSRLVVTGKVEANYAIFISIFLLYSSWSLMADEKLSILTFIASKGLSLLASLALISRLILDCCIIISLKEGWFVKLTQFIPWLS